MKYFGFDFDIHLVTVHAENKEPLLPYGRGQVKLYRKSSQNRSQLLSPLFAVNDKTLNRNSSLPSGKGEGKHSYLWKQTDSHRSSHLRHGFKLKETF